MPMLDWDNYRNQILAGVGELGKLSPDTIKGYVALGRRRAISTRRRAN